VVLFAAFLVLAPAQAFLQTGHGLAIGANSCFGQNGVDDSFIPGLVVSQRIAVVQPIFTSTPYSQYNYGSFYAFYAKYANTLGNVTTDLGWLSTNISSGQGYNQGWGHSYGLYQFLTSPSAQACGLQIGTNVHVLDDISVSAGGLTYPNGSAKFDTVVIPFAEYVTATEYQSYENFVANGGTLVVPAAHSIEWFVDFNTTTKVETFVHGHGFAFNGRSAWRLPCSAGNFTACPWARSYVDWFGSMPHGPTGIQYSGAKVNEDQVIGRALAREFGNVVFSSYRANEENTVTNITGTSIIATFANQSKILVASYVHQFGNGMVVCMCVFGDAIIASDQSAEYFLLLGIVSRSLYPQVACSSSSGSTSTCTVTVKGWNPTGVVSWSYDGTQSISPTTCQLSGGSCSVSVSGSSPGPSLTASYSGDSQNAPSSGRLGTKGGGGLSHTSTAIPTVISSIQTTSTLQTRVTTGPQAGSSASNSLELLGALAGAVAATAVVVGIARRRVRRT
jgi:hypothetical protein